MLPLLSKTACFCHLQKSLHSISLLGAEEGAYLLTFKAVTVMSGTVASVQKEADARGVAEGGFKSGKHIKTALDI